MISSATASKYGPPDFPSWLGEKMITGQCHR